MRSIEKILQQTRFVQSIGRAILRKIYPTQRDRSACVAGGGGNRLPVHISQRRPPTRAENADASRRGKPEIPAIRRAV